MKTPREREAPIFIVPKREGAVQKSRESELYNNYYIVSLTSEKTDEREKIMQYAIKCTQYDYLF